MEFNFTKSSLLAALEISKDKNIHKFNNLNYLESHKTTLDIKNGKKIIEIVGNEIIDKLNNTLQESDRKIILREILMIYIKKAKPGFMIRILGARSHFLEFVSENFEQLLREAGLLETIDLSKEGQIIRAWWDDFEDFVRKLDKDKKIELGREAEEKTMIFEEKKLKRLNISKKPFWAAYENNLLGYDVKSWNEDKDEIFIEVKSSRHPSGIFYLTRNEWNFSKSVKDRFLIHLWIQDNEKPKIISYTQLQSKSYKIEDASNAEWSDIKITPIKIN